MFKLVVSKAKSFKNLVKKNDGWGIAEVLALIVGIVIVVLVMAPSLKLFSLDVINSLTIWWSGIQVELFGV